MKNLDEIKNRYIKEPLNKRLGHLASDLLRISNFLDNPKNIRAVNDILEESKFFIEWTAPEASFQLQALLSEMQPTLALWQLRLSRRKNNSKEKEEIKKSVKNWSSKLIESSRF